MTGITKMTEGRYAVHLDNGRRLVILAEVLHDFDDMVVFQTMFPTGWIVSGESGGVLGDSFQVVTEPLVSSTCGGIDDMHETAAGIRESGDYMDVTADAMRLIMDMLEETDQNE